VLDRVKAGAFGEVPAGKNPPCRPIKQKLVDLDESGRLRCFGWRVGVARPGCYSQRAERDRLPHPDLKRGHPARDLVQGSEHGNRIRNHGSVRRSSQGEGGEQCGDHGKGSVVQNHNAIRLRVYWMCEPNLRGAGPDANLL